MRWPVMPLRARKSRTDDGAAGAERDVVLARAALVGVAFDGDRVLRILLQPARLLAAASAAPRASDRVLSDEK